MKPICQYFHMVLLVFQHFAKVKLEILSKFDFSHFWHTVKGLKQQYPSDVGPLTVTHKFFAAPKPPGKTRAS